MLCVVLQLFVAYGVLAEVSLPQFPPSLEINYFTIAHQISEHQEYPLRQRDYKLLYDKNYGAARFEYEDENGFNIILIRNYHQHYEVRIESLNGTDICEYSYLGQHFPNPTYPSKYDYNGVKSEGENRLLSFSTQIYRQYFDIYFEEVTKLPIRVDEYWINEENRPVPIFSTIYRHIERKESDPWLFDVLYWKDSGRCSRNSKGWPYKHIFGPFVKVLLVFFKPFSFIFPFFSFCLILHHVDIELCI